MFMVILIFIIIFTVVYFLSRALFNKFYKGNQKRKTILIIGSSVVLTPILMAAFIFTALLITFYYPNENFEKTKWIEESSTRYRMTENIIESEMLIGLNLDEVELLLGTDYYSTDSKTIIFQIGAVPGILVLNPDLLIITFVNDLVISVKQETAKYF